MVNKHEFYLAIAALLATLASAKFLLNDLMKSRTYLYLSRKKRRKSITKNHKPVLYWTIVVISAISTLIVFVCCPVLLIEAITGENLIVFGQNPLLEYLIIFSTGFIVIYLISSISARFFTFEEEKLTDLGLNRNIKKKGYEE